MTLNLVKDRLWKGVACTKPVPLRQATGTSTTCPSGTSRLGQVVLFPVGQAGCLYQTCPTGTRKGQKRPFLVPWDMSYTHAGGLCLSRDKLYTHDAACPSSTCPNLSHEVYKAVQFFQNAIQLQPYGGKTHIVLYQEMWLQSRLHVSKLLSAATSQRFKWSGPRPGA